MFLLVTKMILISFSNLFIFLYPIIHFISVCFIYHNSFRPSPFISFVLFITIVPFRSSPLFHSVHHHYFVLFITIVPFHSSPLFRSVHHHCSVPFITIVLFHLSPSFRFIHHYHSVLFITIIPF